MGLGFEHVCSIFRIAGNILGYFGVQDLARLRQPERASSTGRIVCAELSTLADVHLKTATVVPLPCVEAKAAHDPRSATFSASTSVSSVSLCVWNAPKCCAMLSVGEQ